MTTELPELPAHYALIGDWHDGFYHRDQMTDYGRACYEAGRRAALAEPDANLIHTCSYQCERPACIRAQRDELVSRLAELRAEVERLQEARRADEQAWMSLQDHYAALARSVGAKGDAWFGDPLESHEELVALAESLRQRAERAEAQVAELTTQRDYFESERDRLVIQGGELAKLCDDQADRLAQVEIACAQAVDFAEYVVGAAKGAMVERARHYLSLPYSQELAARLSNTYADDAREGR